MTSHELLARAVLTQAFDKQNQSDKAQKELNEACENLRKGCGVSKQTKKSCDLMSTTKDSELQNVFSRCGKFYVQIIRTTIISRYDERDYTTNVWSTNVGFIPLSLCMEKDIFPKNFDRKGVMYQNLSDNSYLPLQGDKLLAGVDYTDENLQWALYSFFNDNENITQSLPIGGQIFCFIHLKIQ